MLIVPRRSSTSSSGGTHAQRTVPPPTLRVKDVAKGAEMGAQLGSSVAFGSYSGKALPGVPRKAPLC